MNPSSFAAGDIAADNAHPLLAALHRPDDDTLEQLHARLGAAAEREKLLDVAYRHIDSPVGSLLLAATETGLVRVAYAREDYEAVLAVLAERIGPRILRAPGRLEDAARQLGEYFAGERTHFELRLDDRLSTGFRRRVLAQLPEIGYGRTVSYAALAQLAGSPKAVRAVGTACGTNPLPVVVPCHRVVRSDGTAGGYIGGPEAKHVLLTLEAAA